MTTKALAALALCCFAACSATGAQTSEWTGVSRWVGKYPVDTIDGRKTSILDEQPLDKALRALLPAADLELLRAYAVAPRIKEVDGMVVVNRCRPRNCPAEMAMLAIDPRAPRVWAGFFTREEGRVSTRWYGNADDYVALPPGVLKEFRERHGD